MKLIIWINVLIWSALAAFAAFLVMDNRPVATAKTVIAVDGEHLTIDRRYTKLRQCTTRAVAYTLEPVSDDHRQYRLPVRSPFMQRQASIETVMTWRVPISALGLPRTPMQYRMRAAITYSCNLLRTNIAVTYSNIIWLAGRN